MAYVSGDLQASTENSWVWTGSETGMNIGGGGGPAERQAGSSSALEGSGREGWTSVLTDIEARDWGGWERVQYLVGVLARGPGAFAQQGPSIGRYNEGAGAGSAPNNNQGRNRGNERMSITNII